MTDEDEDEDWVTPEGGPLLLVPRELYALWQGTSGAVIDGEVVALEPGGASPADYDRACAVEGPVGVIAVGEGQALVVAGPLMSATWVGDATGGAVVLDQGGLPDAAAARALVAGLPAEAWEDADLTLDVVEPDWLLLSATEQGEPLFGEVAVRLDEGRYRVRYARDDGDVGGDLVRLVREGPAPRRQPALREARTRRASLADLLARGTDEDVLGGRAQLYAQGAWTAERAEEAVAALGRLRDPEARLLLVTRLMDAPGLVGRAAQRELIEQVRRDPDRRLLDLLLGHLELDASDDLVRWMIAEDLVRDRVELLQRQLDRSPWSPATFHALLAEVPERLPLKAVDRLASRQIWRWRDRLTYRLLVRCALGVEPVAPTPEVRQGLFLVLGALGFDLRRSEDLHLFALDRRSGFAFFSHLDLMLEAFAALLEDEALLGHRGAQMWIKSTLAASDPELAQVTEFQGAAARERLLAGLARLSERAAAVTGLREQAAQRLAEWRGDHPGDAP